MGEPTEDVIRREIARAREILRSDGHSAQLKRINDRLDKHFPETPSDPADDGKPKPPPPVDPPEPPKKKSVWWGNAE